MSPKKELNRTKINFGKTVLKNLKLKLDIKTFTPKGINVFYAVGVFFSALTVRLATVKNKIEINNSYISHLIFL